MPSLSSTRTPPRPHLLLANGFYNARAIMVLAHELARDDVADAARRGRVRRYKVAFKAALSSAWETARAHRYCFERDQRTAAMPASHAAILAERTSALMGIDSGRRMVVELAAIDARAAALGMRLVSAAIRTRLIAGLEPWASARPQYRLRLGPAVLPFDVLTDDALIDLRSRIAADVRRERSRGAR